MQLTKGDRSAPTTSSMGNVNTSDTVKSSALDESTLALEARATFTLPPGASVAGGYSGVIGKNNNDHGGRETFSLVWELRRCHSKHRV